MDQTTQKLIKDLEARILKLERDNAPKLHTHNGSDTSKIRHADAADVNFIGDLPIGTFKVNGGQTLGGGTVSYPMPIIYGNGVGVYSQFDGGNAPVGTSLIFYNPAIATEYWVCVEENSWIGVSLNLTA